MGYTTDFTGQITVNPPLSEAEIAYINKFSETRRMKCKQGPYYVDRGGYAGQDHGPDVIEYNDPPEGQPGLWCQWVANEEGDAIMWNECEKFYNSAEWMVYLIEHFIGRKPKAKGRKKDGKLPFLKGHVLNGTIEAQGEDSEDTWVLHVRDNQVTVETVMKMRSGAERIIGDDNGLFNILR